MDNNSVTTAVSLSHPMSPASKIRGKELKSFLNRIKSSSSPLSKSRPKSYDYDRKYVEENLIAYIGNKRRLLDLITAAVKEVETAGSRPINRNGLFIDFFAGTGVVSRLMKCFGFNAIANDWEYYSYCLNRGFLECSEDDLALFDEEGGIDRVLDKLNSLTEETGDAYISNYYCPENDEAPDPEHERLFYTRQNGILIDNIRSAIDRLYGNSPVEQKKKDLLLALLLVQSSKRSNTSGVFKGFHHGFGGKKKDALTRILAPVVLEKPRLSPNRNHSIAVCQDALKLADLLKHTPAELVYLDPPYNQHQYGSNYHLLNTIARNDRPEVNKEFWIEGKKVDKSAIRKDWVRTKSGFCYSKTARREFSGLVNKINSKYILVSYSSEGIISLEDMIQILAAKGKIGIITRSYVRYRGGRQADHTQNRNLEFILMVDTGLPSTDKDIDNVKAVFLSGSLQNLFTDFIPVKKMNTGPFSTAPTEEGFLLTLHGLDKEFHLRINRRLLGDSRDIARIRKLEFSQQQQIIKAFTEVLVRPNHVKAAEIHDLLSDPDYRARVDVPVLEKEFKRCFSKVNFRKNPELEESLHAMRENLANLSAAPRFTDVPRSSRLSIR